MGLGKSSIASVIAKEMAADFLEVIGHHQGSDALLAELGIRPGSVRCPFEVEPDYLADTIKDVEALLAEPASDKDPFAALFAEEQSQRTTEGDDVLPEMDR